MDARQALQFRGEAEAYRCVERQVWPHSPVCPKCGSARVGKMTSSSTRFGTATAAAKLSPSKLAHFLSRVMSRCTSGCARSNCSAPAAAVLRQVNLVASWR
jgi:hypothetical protein